MTQPQTPPPTLRRDERGMALALAIFALVIIATLVAGVFFLARLEQRSGSNALWSTQAAEAADAGLNETLANWSSGGYNSMAVGGMPTTLATQTLGSNSRYTATVQRISNQIFLIESRGERTGGGGVLAGTRLGKIVRLIVPDVNINAAVTSNGPVTLTGNITVDGRDTDPPFWPACTTKDTVASVVTSQTITTKGSYSAYGDPSPEGLVPNDGSVTSANFTGPYAAFTGIANKISTGAWSPSNSPRPSLSGANCDTGDFRNWGEPYRNAAQGGYLAARENYSPITWIKNGPGGGNEAHISGGRGQGILIVDNDLQLSGGFEYTGIILVMGDFRTTGQGAKITGALLSANQTTGDITYFGGTPVVTYSSCSIATALSLAAVARPVAERSWVQLY